MGADRIEVPQADDAPFGISAAEVGENLLNLKLCAPVGVRGLPCRIRFFEGQMLRRSVDRGRGAEDEALHARLSHGFEKTDRADQIVVVILKRLRDGLADGLEACEMNDGFDLFVSKRLLEARFVADAAHELRSPLAALSLQAERLEKEDLTPAARERLQTLRAGIDRAVRQVSQLLTLKRAQAKAAAAHAAPGGAAGAETPKADVLRAVQEAVESVYWEAEKLGIQIEVEGVEDLPAGAAPTMPMAFDDLFTILRNLLENAVRYSPAGTAVTLKLDASDSAGPVLTVSDCGPGIPADERARVLEPFYRRLGTGVSGTGLGLAIVKTLCDRWRLTLTLEDARPGNAEAPGLAASIRRA